MKYPFVNKKTLTPTRFFVVVLGILITSAVFSRSAQALTVIPPSVEFTADPGQTIQTEVKLYNETASSMTLYSDVRNFSAKDESGTPTFDFTTEPTDLATWIDVSEEPLVIGAGERVSIPVTITVPNDAEPGGHYAVLFYGNQPPSDGGATQIAIGSKVGSLFLVRVSGEIVENGSIASFGLGDKQFATHLPVVFGLRFNNSGNVHVRPTGTITVTNMFGKTSTTLELNPNKGATLPGTIRNYQTTWEKNTAASSTGNIWSDFWKEVGNEWRNFAFGRYTAQAVMTFGATTPQQTGASVSFWIIPWQLLSILVIIVAAIVLGLIFGIKKYNSWIIQKAQAGKS